MTLNDYQKYVMQTCTTSSNNTGYMLLNLIGEIGELSECFEITKGSGSLENDLKQIIYFAKKIGKVAKQIRKDGLDVQIQVDAEKNTLEGELGDCEWQLSGLQKVLGYEKEYICVKNLIKLIDRQKRNTIIGDGDFR